MNKTVSLLGVLALLASHPAVLAQEEEAASDATPDPLAVEPIQETGEAVEGVAAEVVEEVSDAAADLSDGEAMSDVDTAAEPPGERDGTTEEGAVDMADVPLDDSITDAMDEASQDFPGVVPEPLPDEGEFMPDDTILMESPGYVPSYDEIVERSPATEPEEYVEPGLALRQRVAIRKARTKALQYEEIQAAKANAESKQFHDEQQEAYREYYEMLYARMAKIDSSIKDDIGAALEADLLSIGIAPGTDAAAGSDEEAEGSGES